MSWKRIFLLGFISSLLASLACIIYAQIYKEAFYVDFGGVVGPANIISSCIIGCLLMAVGYKTILHFKGSKALGWTNIAYSILSFVSIIGVLGFNLPLDMESPEMFPGMVIPMHFFPVLSLLTVFPFFQSHVSKH